MIGSVVNSQTLVAISAHWEAICNDGLLAGTH